MYIAPPWKEKGGGGEGRGWMRVLPEVLITFLTRNPVASGCMLHHSTVHMHGNKKHQISVPVTGSLLYIPEHQYSTSIL